MIKLRRINCNWEDDIDEDKYYPGADVTGEYEKEYGRESDEYTLLGRKFTRIPSEKIPPSLKVANAIDHEAVHDDLIGEFYTTTQGIMPFNYIYSGEVDIRTYGNDFLIQWRPCLEYTHRRVWETDPISKIFPYPEDLVETVIDTWLADWKNGSGKRVGRNVCIAYLDKLEPLVREDEQFLYRICNILSVNTVFDTKEVFQRAESSVKANSHINIFYEALQESDLDTVWEKARALRELINKPDIKHAIYHRTGEYNDN